MSLKLGLHTGQQDCTYDDLRRLWRLADAAGFYWISVWDHHFESPPVDGRRSAFETISIMSALALETKSVRVGCLVFSPSYRNPGLVAKAITTIDHLSDGRVEIGLGAGWHEAEYRAFGFGFPSAGKREDQLEEMAQIVREMLHEGSANFEGEYFSMHEAFNVPRPIQEKIRIWIGGAGERRTIPAAAKYADAWNGAYLAPEIFRHKLDVVGSSCEKIGRDPASMQNAINLGFYMGTDEASANIKRRSLPWAPNDPRRQGQILGTAAEAIDRINEYVRAGAQQVNLAIRAPFDWDAIESFIEDVMPAL